VSKDSPPYASPTKRIGWGFFGVPEPCRLIRIFRTRATPVRHVRNAVPQLSRVDRGDLNYGKRTFDCVPCDRHETVIVQYR